LRTTPMALILVLMALSSSAEYSSQGILLAVLSGAIASGLGYMNAADSVRSIQPCGSQEKKNDLTQLTEESIHELLFFQ